QTYRLRAFFRYAHKRGWCRSGLAEAIQAPRVFTDRTLPCGPSWADVRRLLATAEGDEPKAVRDRAILLLLAVYALRAGEVRRLRPLGVTLPHYGAHALRHACATHLLSEGLSLKEIGDHLGHQHPDATRTYAKVDLAGLRQVAGFDLGGLQ